MRLAMLAVLALIALPSSSWAADVEANKRLFRDWIEEVWNKRQPSAIDRYLAPNFIEHSPNIPPGVDGRKQFVAALQAGFSDYRAEIEQIVAEGNMLVVRVLWTGTQDGPFLGQPPSGRKVTGRSDQPSAACLPTPSARTAATLTAQAVAKYSVDCRRVRQNRTSSGV